MKPYISRVSEFITKHTEYPTIILKNTINDKDATIVGIDHRERFFLEHEQFFEDIVSSHDAVMLETPLRSTFWEDESFFGRIGDIAHSQQKNVYQADPLTIPVMLSDIFGTIPLSAVMIMLGWTTNNWLLAALGAYLNFGSLASYGLRGFLNMEGLLNFGADDALSYGVTDYRNVVIAGGIDTLCNEIESIDSVVAIHGQAHSGTVDGYLNRPRLRKMKKSLYYPYDLIANPYLREYIPTDDAWELTKRIRI